jgi:DNA-directed RNA polymerase II subunit RPB7
MFFLKEEERTITLHPSFFGPNIQRYLDDQLLSDVEGTVQGDYFVVCVLEPHDYSEGKIVPGSAFAEFRVHYRAVVWKPFKGEVVCIYLAKGLEHATQTL